ncbi:hypothetical protein F4801DRAFT_574451 [Xylaria longipes]|nr:hypothetical protein F4801DRAFT_574451 [Xylaria longipes]
MDAQQNENGLLPGTERCNALFDVLLAKFPNRQGNDYQTVLDSHKGFQTWIPSLLESPTDMAGDKGIFIRQVVKSIEDNLQWILEMESHKTEQGSEHRALRELSKDILSVVSDSIDRLKDFATVVSRKLAEAEGYDQRRAAPNTYDALVIRGLILSRFPELSESILRLLERSVVARRKRLLSPRNGRLTHSWRSEPAKDQESSDMESPTSVPPPSWNDHQYPDPPEADDDAETRRCNWCHHEVQVSKLKDSTWWRKHFLADLQPYVCLMGCEHPRMFFSRFHEWQDHMDFFHSEDWIQKLQKLDEWYCDITSCPSEQQKFGTSRELQAHFYLVHGRDVPLVQIASMPKKGVEPSPDELSICPLCHQQILTERSALVRACPAGDIIDDGGDEEFVYSNAPQGLGSSVADELTADMSLPIPLEDPTAENPETREILVKHIASDIKSLAFLSLRDIGSETTHAEPSNLTNHRKDRDDILWEDNGSDVSLSVRISGSPKSDFGTLSNRAVSVRPKSSVGAKESSIRDNGDYVYWSGHSEYRLPLRSTRGDRNEKKAPVIVGDSRATRAGRLQTELSAGSILKIGVEGSVSTIATSSHMRDEINDALVESAFDNGRRFLPARSLERLVTSENIREALAYWDAGDEEIKSLVDFVLGEARKIFVIIVDNDMIDVGDALKSLRKSGVTDRHLPIPRELIECGRMKGRSAGKECRHDAVLGVFHKKPWRRSPVSEFYHSQWKFLAPVFTPDHKDIILDMRAILPLVHVGRDARMGFFSEVYEVELHRDHHRGIVPLEDGHDLRVALKELRMDSRDDELRSVFERETESLKALRKFRHEHMITTIASIVRGARRFFIFPWADGTDLRAFWMTNEFWPLTPHLIQEVVQQLNGLAGALDALHERGWRHGDVKPENILRFKNETTLGTLKIGDMGLARPHYLKTQLRSVGTATRIGTMRYEPPETVTSSSLPRSRKYDIWSMGCVIMEFVMWLLYGPKGLNEFSRALSKDSTFGEAFYSTRQGVGSELQGEVHPVVRFWLDELSKNPDWPRDSVIADLVRLVATHLLVVRTSLAPPISEQPSSEQSSAPSIMIARGSELNPSDVRADAKMLQEQLRRIQAKCLTEPEYLFPRAARAALYRRAIPDYQNPRAVLVPSRFGNDLKPSALRAPVLAAPKYLSRLSQALEVGNYDDKQVNDLGDAWEYITDNDFASRFFQSFDGDLPTIPGPSTDQICERCTDIDFCSPDFSVVYSTKYLEESAMAGHCHLCSLLHSALAHNGMNTLDSPSIQFKRYGSTLKLRTGDPPVLSIVADSSNLMVSPTARLIPADIQIGFPTLQNLNSAVPRHLLRQWLANCEAEHQCISRNKPNRYFPKRLLLVKNDDAPTVRLVETAAMVDRPESYITLSYVWGSHGYLFRKLLKSNYDEFLRGVPAGELERTFRDAALVALQIGISYLWIDSLCLIQDDQDDIAAEIINMDQVFQGSHCTIALSSAVSIQDGFLKQRRQRGAVQIKRKNGGTYYVCELIDDFDKDVEESPLSSRGWAFQERVLSRRTIFFTDAQTYWQCGDGIRCETLTKMTNWKSGILGDPDFPMLSLRTLAPIQTYEQFYERYSLLRFNFGLDRSRAIQPLEKRLLQALGSEGGYGVVARFLGRSLLWRRAPGQTLERIKFPAGQNIPSWSWQAYIGGINYLSMPPGTIDWKQIHCRFGNTDSRSIPNESSEAIGELTAEAWDFDVQALLADISNNLTVVWDRGEHGRRKDLKCITVGSSEVHSDGTGPPPANYLLIVAPSADCEAFERLGVGYMDGEEPAIRTKLVVKVR